MATPVPVHTRSLRRRARTLEVLIWSKGVLASLVFLVMIEQLRLLFEYRAAGLPAQLAVDAIERDHRLLLNVNNLTMLCAAIVWLLWQYALRRSLVAPSTRPFRYGAGGGLLWWFVPFANTVVPLSVMSELSDAEGSRTQRTLEIWWSLWNGQVILLYVAFIAAMFGALDAVGIRIASFIAELLFLLSVIPAVKVVRALTMPAAAALDAFASIPPAPLDLAERAPLHGVPSPIVM